MSENVALEIAMATSETIGKKIAATIKNDPLLKGTAIQIIVTDDFVLLSGIVNQYRKKQLAVQIAIELAYPLLVNHEIEVVPEVRNDDTVIAGEIAKRLSLNFGFASDKIAVTVNKGYVRLQGQMSWSYQRELALQSISDIVSICDICNEITVSPIPNEYLIKKQILNILTMVTSCKIDVRIVGTVVVLQGSVSNFDEKIAIGQAIGRIRGAGKIINELTVLQGKTD